MVITMIIAMNGVNALKIEYDDYNIQRGAYSDGEKIFSSRGYIYHGGSFHKTVKAKPEHRSYCYNGYNKKCKYYGRTTIGMWYVQGKVSEIKKISHGSIRVNGKYHNKKIKMYTDYDRYEGQAKFPKFHPTNNIKGNLLGKTVTVSVHDDKGKVLAFKSFKVSVANIYFWTGP